MNGILKDNFHSKSPIHTQAYRILAGISKKSVFGVLSFVMSLVLLATGCAVGPLPESEEPGGEPVAVNPFLFVPTSGPDWIPDYFLVYAAADGLYRTSLDGSGAEMIHEGARLSNPVLSKDGDMVMFRQAPAPELSNNPGLYVYHFGLGQGILLKESSYSYCAGPDNTFVMAATDGRLLQAAFQTVEKDGAETLEYQTEDISVWPEAVDKNPLVSIQYENLKPSPDFHYLAYNVSVEDNRTDNRPEGFGPYYSGGLYVLDRGTGEAATVVEPIRATETSMGNYPEPGPWSPDGKTLWVWDKPQSASLTADGVDGFFYHADTGQKTEYGINALSYTGNWISALAYDENISFSDVGTAAILTGGNREMFVNKQVNLVADYSGTIAGFQEVKSIAEDGLIPAMPQLSADGKTLYFAAISKEDGKGYEKGNWTSEQYQAIWPLKRQLYSVALEDSGGAKAGEITQITTDPAYRNENPVLLADESHLVFGRASAEAYDGKMEIWIKDLVGGGEIKLAEWTEPSVTDPWMAEKYNDFYGRGSWSSIFAIYDAAK